MKRLIIVQRQSYGLKVHSPGSDMDIIVIGPSFATLHDDFLVRLYNLVRNLPRAIHVQSIPGAKVPLIRFKRDDISVDMCYARVNLLTIPKAEEIDFFTLTPLDPSGRLALSSLLTNVTLSTFTSYAYHGERFLLGVRLIKFWARRRGIYGNLIGYLGGVHWTALFFYVFIQYPAHPLIWLLSFFFWTFSNWSWPVPVFYGSIADPGLYLQMPIQKPGSREFLHSNVKVATRDRIVFELRRAAFMTQGMQSILYLPMCGLFEVFDYGEAYPNFLKIRLSVIHDYDDALDRWVGLAQSRFPHLLNQLETGHMICDPRLTEYRDIGRGPNKVFLWGIMKEAGGSHILPQIQERWKHSLRSYPSLEGDINLSVIPAYRYKQYIPL